MRLVVHFNGCIPLKEIEEALYSRGIFLRQDARGQLTAEPAPRFLIKNDWSDAQRRASEQNVVRFGKGGR